MIDPASIAAICAGTLSLLTAFGTFLLRANYEEIVCCFGACDFRSRQPPPPPPRPSEAAVHETVAAN